MDITEATLGPTEDGDEPLTDEWLRQHGCLVAMDHWRMLYRIKINGLCGNPLFTVSRWLRSTGDHTFGVGVELADGFRSQYRVRTRGDIRRFAALHRIAQGMDGVDQNLVNAAATLIGMRDNIESVLWLMESAFLRGM